MTFVYINRTSQKARDVMCPENAHIKNGIMTTEALMFKEIQIFIAYYFNIHYMSQKYIDSKYFTGKYTIKKLLFFC